MDEIRTKLKRSLIDSWWDIEDADNFGRVLPRTIDTKDIDLLFFRRTCESDKFARCRMMQSAVDSAAILADTHSLNISMAGFGVNF